MSVSMLSEQMAKAGVYTEAYATTANGKTELQVTLNQPVNVEGVPVTYFKRITKDHSHFSPALLTGLWKNVRSFDTVHIHAWWNLVSLFSCLVALMRGLPVIVSPRGTLSPYAFKNKNINAKYLIHRLLGKPMLRRCHIHSTSAREQQAVLRLVRPKSINTIPNFVKLSPLQVHAEGEGVFRLLFL